MMKKNLFGQRKIFFDTLFSGLVRIFESGGKARRIMKMTVYRRPLLVERQPHGFTLSLLFRGLRAGGVLPGALVCSPEGTTKNPSVISENAWSSAMSLHANFVALRKHFHNFTF